MKIREMVAASVEMSLAEQHRQSALDQVKSSGEKPKIIGASRYLPKSLVSSFLGLVQKDTLPLSLSVDKRPLGYGTEAVVYELGEDSVLKLYHSSRNTAEIANEYMNNQRLMQSVLGSLVVPAYPFFYESRYRTHEPRFAMMQKKINGKCLFTSNSPASPKGLLELQRGATIMSESYGLVPDFSGDNNVLVTKQGDIKIIDCGFLISLNKIDESPMQREHMEWLQAQAEILERSAS